MGNIGYNAIRGDYCLGINDGLQVDAWGAILIYSINIEKN